MFRNGQTEEAVRRKDANGTLHIVPGGYREAIDHVAELWKQRRNANRDRPRYSISVSAPTNAQAHDISVAIRERRKGLGEIGADRMTVQATDGEGVVSYDLNLATGDRVRLFKRTNAKFAGTDTVGNIGRNGTVLEVTGVRDEGLMLRNPAGKEGLVAWSSLRDERSGKAQLAYGDAVTTYTAQGTTVTEHIHAIPAGSRLVSAFAAYTSGSRHRERSFIVTSEGAERAEIVARRPLGDRREIMRGDIMNNIVRNFSQQPQKESALDMLDRAASLRRGTIRSVQTALHSMEARSVAGQNSTTLGARFVYRRVYQALEGRISDLVERLRWRGEVIARAVRAGAAVAEQLAAIARRPTSQRHSEVAYWREARRAGEKFAPVREHVEAEERSKTRGRGL